MAGSQPTVAAGRGDPQFHAPVIPCALKACPFIAFLFLCVACPAFQTNLFDNGQWVVVAETEDAGIPELPMTVRTNGVPKVQAKRVMFSNRSPKTGSYPQVAVVACSGFIRLKPGADPSPAIPFGASVVLGPAYFDEHDVLYYNPQLTSMDILTSRLLPDGTGTLVIRMTGDMSHALQRGGLAVEYEIELVEPSDFETRLKVTQSYHVTRPFFLREPRMTGKEGFRVVQFSSMYLGEGTHDSSGAKFIAADGRLRLLDFRTAATNVQLLADAAAMGEPWFDSVHRDNTGFQGNTPNVRLLMDNVFATGRYVPQAYINASASPANDNVSLWVHDSLAPSEFRIGDRGTVTYSLIARDDPFLNTAGPIVGVDYGPYRVNQGPDIGVFPSIQDLQDDMPVLRSMAEVIRTYSSLNSLSNIAGIASASALKVVQAAWIGSDEAANSNEVDGLILLCNQHSNVTLAVVGSEAVLRNEKGWGNGLTPAKLLGHVNRVRQNVTIPVTVAEPWHIWRDYPELVEGTDLIFMNLHPYWEGQPVTNAANHLAQKYREVRDLYPSKQIVISETGWPSGGQVNGLAVPGVSNQKEFAEDFAKWATVEGVGFCWFQAFDETWKTGEVSGVGTNWGLCFADRTSKHSVTSFLPDCVVAKVADHDPVVAGTPVVYTVTVSNRGPSAAEAIVVRDSVPAGMVVIGVESGAGTCTVEGAAVHWSVGFLTNREASATLTAVPGRAGVYTNRLDAAGRVRDARTNDNAAVVVTVVEAAPDLDGDGLPDWWEQKHFGDATSGAPAADPDSDGMTNLREYRCGTDPTNSASLLVISGLQVEPYRSILFTGVATRAYGLPWTNDLSGDTPWPVLQSNLAGRSGLMSFTDTNAASRRVYGVEAAVP